MTYTRKRTKAVPTELSEKQLDDVSGGPLIIKIWDYREPEQKGTLAVKHVSGFDGREND